MNLVKNFLLGGKTRVGIGALGGVRTLIKALLLSILDLYIRLWPVSLFCFLVGSAK